LAGRADAFEMAAEKLAAVGLEDRSTHYPSQLSGGEQQRVALARAVCTNPKILLADEPTGNLDGKTGHIIVDLMFELHAQQEATLILITHDDQLARRCDHLVRLEDGRIAAIESMDLQVAAGE
jgi:putative ABC transport system ATP-binding protein